MGEVSTIQLPSPESAIALSGEQETNLKTLAQQTGATLVLRGQDLYISGTEKQIELCRQLVRSLENLWLKGNSVALADILTARIALDTHRQEDLQDLQRDILAHLGRPKVLSYLLRWRYSVQSKHHSSSDTA